MTKNKQQFFFWTKWMLTNALGWGLGFGSILVALLIVGVMVMPAPEIQPGSVTWAVFFSAIAAMTGGVGGLLVGSAQWLVLRRHVSEVGGWVFPSIAGWALGPGLFMGMNWSIEKKIHSTAINQPALIAGITVGLLSVSIGQWLILSRKSRQAAWWIPVNIVGTGLAGGTAYALCEWALDLDSLCLGLILPGIPAGAVYGLVTGWALWTMLQFSKEMNANSQAKNLHQSAC